MAMSLISFLYNTPTGMRGEGCVDGLGNKEVVASDPFRSYTTGSSKEVDEEKKSPDDEARRVKLLKMILMRIQMGKK
jgi:hypothetical protein